MQYQPARNLQNGQEPVVTETASPKLDILRVVGFLQNVMAEIDGTLEPSAPNPYLNMLLHLVDSHFRGRTVSPSSMAANSGVPYATSTRKLADLVAAGLIEQRPRTKTGKTFSLHPSETLLALFDQLSGRIDRIGQASFGPRATGTADYYFGGSYQAGQSTIPRFGCCRRR